MTTKALAVFIIMVCGVEAQIPTFSGTGAQKAPANTNAEAPKGVANPLAGITGVKEVPVIDQDSDTVLWDGKMWSLSNNRLLEARYDKFLNEPVDEAVGFSAYTGLLNEITELVTANPLKPMARDWLSQTFAKLHSASQYPADAGIADTIMLQTVSAWQAAGNRVALNQAAAVMRKEKEQNEWNRGVVMSSVSLTTNTTGADGARSLRAASYTQHISELETAMKSNEAKDEIGKLKSKIEFQALIAQLFMQRRFQHVIIASRIYGTVYNDGDRELQTGEELKKILSRTSGLPPSLQTLETLSREVMGDVDKGVKSSLYSINKGDLYSGSRRLMESFLPGEYLGAIRSLPRDVKQQVLGFERDGLKLKAAIEVKDYDLATSLITSLGKAAKDFDDTKARGAVETAKAEAGFHIAKAQAAAANGEKEVMNAELDAAGQIWPRNPDLKAVGAQLLAMSGNEGKTIAELDVLIRQGDDRRIFDQKERFIAAVAFAQDRQKPLSDAIARVMDVEKLIGKAQELQKAGNSAGAWETLNAADEKAKGDPKLAATLSEISNNVAEYISIIAKAKESEGRGNIGSALALYLKARDAAPMGTITGGKIRTLAQQTLQQ